MKLLYAIKSMDHTHGGAEKVLADVTAGLSEKGHQVSVLTFDKPGGQSFYSLHPDVERISLGIGNAAKKSTFFETIRRVMALRRIVLKEKPDIVVAFMHSMFIPMALALAGTGIPIIASEHIVPEHYKTRRLEFTLFVISSFMVERVTVLSEKVRDLYPSFLRSRMDIMPNPVYRAKEAEAEITVPAARKVILNVGRLDPQKDQATLIEAFAELAPHYPDWDLRIVGEGELRPELEKLAREKGLADRIFMPGTTREIDREYKQAHIFAMPSRYEAFGLATAEAMSFGVPALGFADCPGTNEVIAHEHNGLLVSGDDRIQAFRQGLEELMESEALRTRLGHDARSSVEQYSDENVFNNWEKLLDHIRIYQANANTGNAEKPEKKGYKDKNAYTEKRTA